MSRKVKLFYRAKQNKPRCLVSWVKMILWFSLLTCVSYSIQIPSSISKTNRQHGSLHNISNWQIIYFNYYREKLCYWNYSDYLDLRDAFPDISGNYCSYYLNKLKTQVVIVWELSFLKLIMWFDLDLHNSSSLFHYILGWLVR